MGVCVALHQRSPRLICNSLPNVSRHNSYPRPIPIYVQPPCHLLTPARHRATITRITHHPAPACTHPDTSDAEGIVSQNRCKAVQPAVRYPPRPPVTQHNALSRNGQCQTSPRNPALGCDVGHTYIRYERPAGPAPCKRSLNQQKDQTPLHERATTDYCRGMGSALRSAHAAGNLWRVEASDR